MEARKVARTLAILDERLELGLVPGRDKDLGGVVDVEDGVEVGQPFGNLLDVVELTLDAILGPPDLVVREVDAAEPDAGSASRIGVYS